MALKAGDPLPQLTLIDGDQRQLDLASLAGEPTLLVFLRHLACLPCREHLLDLMRERERLSARIVAVSFSPPQLLHAFRHELSLDASVILASDTQRTAYEAFGFERGSIARVWLHPRVWVRYAELLARGRRLRSVGQDTLQLGGDVVSDAAGKIAWVYSSKGPDDRPSIDQIIAALERARHSAPS